LAIVVTQSTSIAAVGPVPLIFLTNLCLAVAVACGLLSNRQLMLDSYLIYGFQFFTLLPCVLARTRWLSDTFLPSTFVLAYFLVNLALGAYLVPRGYGWNKEFAEAASRVQHYPLITAYLMACNVALAWLSLRALARLSPQPTDRLAAREKVAFDQRNFLWRSALFLLLFAAVGAADVYSAFSFQFGIIILHLADPSLRSKRLRYPIYLIYIGVMIAVSFENKREVAMTMFAIIFLECFFTNARLRFTPIKLLSYASLFGVFLIIVIVASVLRGYGEYVANSPFDLIRMVSGYIGSDIFADGITDNLELNYNYGVTVTSIDFALRGLIDFQYGATVIKPLFLPFPRELIDWKPESALQIFTRAYAPDWWAEGGSMPVSLAAEMFINFHVVGVLGLVAIVNLLNKIFVHYPPSAQRLSGYSSAFLALTVLMFARGSGFEQYLLYYGVSLVVFIVYSGLRHVSKPDNLVQLVCQ
jgi:hypothetical protein